MNKSLNSSILETNKKKKKKEDTIKETLNEEFMLSTEFQNPGLDFKKTKYENVNELLTLYYDQNTIND